MTNKILWMRSCNVSGDYYKPEIPKLTNDELIKLLEEENRLTGRKILTAEAKKRGLPNVCWKCGCVENRACLGGCYWVKPGLCSQCAEKAVERGR
jgi:hypothetical protein